MNLRDRALALLARREHSRAELARKLAPHAEDEEISLLLDELEGCSNLSDARYAEALRHARSGKYGSLRLKQELRDKGVASDLAAEEVEAARVQDMQVARSVWAKKFGAPPQDLRERMRQIRFLLSRGFPPEVAARVVGGGSDEE